MCSTGQSAWIEGGTSAGEGAQLSVNRRLRRVRGGGRVVPWMEGPGGKDARSEVMGEAEASGADALGVQGWEAAAY